MCTFYYPKFHVDKAPEPMETMDEFINYYSVAYYNDCGFKIKRVTNEKQAIRAVGQNSRYVEKIIDGLLKKTDPYDERDLIQILSWKIGKIKQRDSEKEFITNEGREKLEPLLNEVSDLANPNPRRFSAEYKKAYEKYISDYDDAFKNIDRKQKSYIIYADKWLPSEWKGRGKGTFSDVSCFQFVGAFGKKLGISELIKFITENNELTTKAKKGDPQEVLNEFLVKNNNGEDAINGIGTVYLLTVLYFLSNGEWPIYDRFADKALKAICGNKKPGDTINADILPGKNGYVNKDRDDTFNHVIEKHIKCYKKRIEIAFNGYEDYKDKRDIDRALWVYGHLFT